MFQSVLEKNVEARKYFLSLNNNDVSIAHLLKKLQLNLDSVESISKAINNQEVVRIIDESAKRLLNRNYVIAGIHYLYEKELHFKKIFDLSSQKTTVFVSGSGNELLKVLGKFPELDAYQFIIFDKEYEGFLQGNLGYILSHRSDRIPAHFNMRSKDLQNNINSYISASKTLNKKLSKYNASTTLIKTRPFLYNHLNNYIDHTDKNSCLILLH